MSDELEFQIAKLAMGPDDILVIKPSRILTAVAAAETAARLGHRFGLAGRVMIIGPDDELSVIARTAEEPSREASPEALSASPASSPPSPPAGASKQRPHAVKS